MTPSSVDPAVVVQLEVEPSPAATVRIEPPSAWLEFAFARSLGISRTLFLRVARSKVRYKQTVIGVVWVVLQPLRVHPVFGLAPWTYYPALTTSTNVVVDDQRVVGKAYFPRLISPLSGRPRQEIGLT
jgi:lipopolysaccharide transport system permease protein